MWLFVLILGLPLIEISLFVTLGAWLGLWATLAIVVGTAVLGVWLLRRQGANASADLRANLLARKNPVHLMAGDALTAVSAILLILPGFLTDTVGLLLLLPPVRRWIATSIARRARAKIGAHLQARTWEGASSMAAGARRPDEVIDATWEELPPGDGKPGSGWTRH